MKKIFKLLKIKKIFFSPPKKTDIIIFDRTNSHIFKPYIKNTKMQQQLHVVLCALQIPAPKLQQCNLNGM